MWLTRHRLCFTHAPDHWNSQIFLELFKRTERVFLADQSVYVWEMNRPRAVLGLSEEDNQTLSRRERADNILKARFLEALTRNDAAEVAKILRTTSIEIDTVLDVEDRDMILASYKQGNSCWQHNSRSFTGEINRLCDCS